MKSEGMTMLITLMMISSMFPSISATPLESHHVPRLYRGTMVKLEPFQPWPEPLPDWPPQPYMFGYMDTNGTPLRVDKIQLTVSFPDTDPSVIQTDNWLAGGMFAVGYNEEEIAHAQLDYGFYTMLTLEHDGSLYLDFGINETYECLNHPTHPRPHGPLPWTRGLFNATVHMEGVSPSTPITLTTSWDTPYPGYVSWNYTVNGITYLAKAENITKLAPAIQHVFYVGSRDLDKNVLLVNPTLNWIHYWQVYSFQFGVISLYNIGHGGWNVLLSNPSYFKDGEWHNVEPALSMGGTNAILDYRWFWGGENYDGVEAYCYPLLGAYNVQFYYSGFTLEDFTPLWRPGDETTAPHTIKVPIRPSDDSSTYTSPDPVHAYAETNLNYATYRLEVGEREMNGTDYSAGVSLFKDYVPTHTITNPTFYFRFHDIGYMASKAPYPESYTWLYFYLRLWHNGEQVFECTKPIYYVTNDTLSFYHFHDVIHTYAGELLEGNTYTFEYSFEAFEHEAYTDFRTGDQRIKAKWLAIADNYKLTVRTYELGGSEITNVNVWLDSTHYSSPVENLVVACEDHTVQVESPFYQNGHRYAFQYWEDDNTSNPRTVDILNDTTLRTYYIREPLCAMKTKTNGSFYVPIVATDLLKIEILFNIQNFTGDQTGGTSPYGSIGNYPDGKVNIKDSVFIGYRFGSNETAPNWDYMADVVPDRKINIKDITAMNVNFGYSGTYPPLDLTGVQVIFNTNDTLEPDSYGFVSIPQNATSFTVKRYGAPIGAMITFW